MAHKPFSERLKELIDDEYMFPGNPDAAAEGVIAALEERLAWAKAEYAQDKADREKFRAGR